MTQTNKSKKILLLYALIALAFFIFLSVMLLNALKKRHIPSTFSSEKSRAIRGNILSADHFILASSVKLYKAEVNTKYIDPNKKELFIQLFSIYSGVASTEIRKKLQKKNSTVVLSYKIKQIQAQYLKTLSKELRRLKVFVYLKNKNGYRSTQGLSIRESGESRIYPYGKLLTPLLGFTQKKNMNSYTTIVGKKGLERKFNHELTRAKDGFIRGNRDVNSYIIRNKESFTKQKRNGVDLQLSIETSLELKIETMLDSLKEELEAKEIFVAIMDSKNGKVLSLASSNRYYPKAIKKSEYSYLNISHVEYSYEPGSVIKPLIFSLLLEKNRVTPHELVNGHRGKFRIGKKLITDEHKFQWMGAEDVIIHSSNIGIAQLARKLHGREIYEGLQHFGLSVKSTPDLSQEKLGSILSPLKLEDEIYKATASYGYGINANLMQLLRAYNLFNNKGRSVMPRIVQSYTDAYHVKHSLSSYTTQQIISEKTANTMKRILIKTVQKGTGKKTITEGLEVGGKTGTSHIVQNGVYVKRYNSSFLGFVNDKTQGYTMGVVVVEPQKKHFASQSAAPVFKLLIDILVEENYLHPDVVK